MATPESIGDGLVEHLDDLNNNLLRRILLILEGNIKKNSRVRTGTFRRAWSSRIERSGERGRVGNVIRYAPFQKNKPIDEGIEDSRSAIERELHVLAEAYFTQVIK